MSLGIGVASVLAHDRFVNRRIQYPEQVLSDLGLPILGVVPSLKLLAARAGGGESESSPHVQSLVESFRALRTQITLGLGIEYPAVIAITSPGKGEGKSLITSNLALAFSPIQTGLLFSSTGTFGVEGCIRSSEPTKARASPTIFVAMRMA
jgi:hypothetical protein